MLQVPCSIMWVGQEDLKARVLRAIGEPALRFAEDKLRMLRGVRFAARLGLEIESRTMAAIRASASEDRAGELRADSR